MKIFLCAMTALATVGAAPLATAATPGGAASVVTFGQTAALEGPTANLGRELRAGLEAAFAEANAAGGVDGRSLELVSYDDGYEPEMAIDNARRLITEDQVFALIGGVGTPTALATTPIAREYGVPFIGQVSGGEFLRNPFAPGVVNYRASLAHETEALVEHVTQARGASRIAVFFQNDSYGKAGLAGVEAALERRGMTMVAAAPYERNTTVVKTAVVQLRRAAPDAIIMLGASKPCAAFIKLADRVGLDAVFANVSFVGATAFAAELGPLGEGVVVSQVVPYPWDDSRQVVADYHAAMAARDDAFEPGFMTLEGYMIGRMTIEALRRVEGDLTREAFLQAVYRAEPIDLGGVTLDFGPADNQGLEQVFVTAIGPNGTFEALN